MTLSITPDMVVENTTPLNRDFFMKYLFQYAPTLCEQFDKWLPLSEIISIGDANRVWLILLETASYFQCNENKQVGLTALAQSEVSKWFGALGLYVIPYVSKHVHTAGVN